MFQFKLVFICHFNSNGNFAFNCFVIKACTPNQYTTKYIIYNTSCYKLFTYKGSQLENTHCRGKDHLLLVSILTGLELTKQENILLFACTEFIESKPVKVETSSRVILPPTYSECSLSQLKAYLKFFLYSRRPLQCGR